MNALQKSIIRTLLYFDIFGHPLNKTELIELISLPSGADEFDRALNEILTEQLVECESGYFFLKSGHAPVQNRIEKLRRAEKYYKIAGFVSKIIYLHPFVRGIFLTGSLSKNVTSTKDDIDFFIVAEPGKLWVCRGFLMLFKKIFLLNSKKYFCINYFVDTTNLEIPEKNIFTATELAFIKPMQNLNVYSRFISTNGWVKEYFPNKNFKLEETEAAKEPLVKRITEALFRRKLGVKLDDFFLSIYIKRARKKFGYLDENSFDLNFRSKKNVSKHHPRGFQQKILNDYDQKIAEFEKQHSISLNL